MPRPEDETLLWAALGYARRGWRVFPVHSIREGLCSCGRPGCPRPGKHPLTRHGFKDASTDEATTRAWWGRWHAANIGIRTGKESRLVVLDVDSRHGGDGSIRRLEAQYGRLPETARADGQVESNDLPFTSASGRPAARYGRGTRDRKKRQPSLP